MHHVGQSIGVIDVYCVEEMERLRKSAAEESAAGAGGAAAKDIESAAGGFTAEAARWQK